VAATAATLFDQAGTLATKAGTDAISQASARPDFAVLMYPVITMDKGRTHPGSRKNLIGADADAALTDRFSAQLHVTPQTPPLLIVQAEDDHTVPPVNAVLMATAAAEQHVPCRLVLLHAGGHGFGMGKPGTEPAEWFGDLLAWMGTRHLLEP
jgi:dipeptidyl aminopeptidase/acylaminoacyl peptidase